MSRPDLRAPPFAAAASPAHGLWPRPRPCTGVGFPRELLLPAPGRAASRGLCWADKPERASSLCPVARTPFGHSAVGGEVVRGSRLLQRRGPAVSGLLPPRRPPLQVIPTKREAAKRAQVRPTKTKGRAAEPPTRGPWVKGGSRVASPASAPEPGRSPCLRTIIFILSNRASGKVFRKIQRTCGQGPGL